MFEELLKYVSRRPDAYEPGETAFWNDAHISKGMLKTHLNLDEDLATRRLDFVRRSAGWIAQTADPAKRPSLLDLGCGPGIYAGLFYAQGFSVTGVDISPRSIAYARERAAAEGMDIEYRCQDYLDIDDTDAFDVATLIYCDFGVLSPENREKLLKKIFCALKPGGLFIVDVCTMKQYEGREETAEWSYSGGGLWSASPYACLYSFHRYDDCRTFADRYVIVEADRVRCFHIWNHGFTVQELEADLRAAGFSAVSFFMNVAGEPWTEESKTLCAVAQKA